MAKRHTRHRRQRRQRKTRRRTRKMRGGAFSQNEVQQLENQGFTEYQIQTLTDLGVSFNEVMQKINTIMNQSDSGFHGNSDDLTEQVMVELLNEHIFENPNVNDGIPHADDDIHNIDDNNLNLSLDDSLNDSQGSFHLSDLNVTNDSMDSNTTIPDDSFNNSQMSDISIPSNLSENESFTSETGGKKRRRKTQRKTRKGRKSRKQRGGMCYGNGVGANSYDPNFSIYNTRELELFPYRPK
jgi:hypothetical protein